LGLRIADAYPSQDRKTEKQGEIIGCALIKMKRKLSKSEKDISDRPGGPAPNRHREIGPTGEQAGNLRLHKTAWWGWEDSNFQPNDYQPPELND
jgi:hypothetical protein